MKRRSATALIVVTLIVTAVTSATSHARSSDTHTQPGGSAAFMQMADAVWIVPQDRVRGTFYFAGALRMAPTLNGMETWGFVGKGKCITRRDKHGSSTICSGAGRGHRLDMMEFELDPLLDSAHMTLETKEFTHAVTWEGRGERPDVAQSVQTGGQSIQAMAALARNAKAVGTLYGDRLDRGRGFSFLFQGVLAYAQLNALGYSFTDDGRLVVERTFRF